MWVVAGSEGGYRSWQPPCQHVQWYVHIYIQLSSSIKILWCVHVSGEAHNVYVCMYTYCIVCYSLTGMPPRLQIELVQKRNMRIVR